jgi:aspartate/methionine/tyrosine aminotransferase
MDYPMKLAKRLENIEPFHVMDLLGRAKSMEKAGRDIIHLEVGEPDFTSPQGVIEAGISALQQGLTHYTAATGLPELKMALAKFYRQRFAADVDPQQIIITPGASGALQLVTSLLVNPDESLLLTDPGYPCNRHFLANINAYGQMVATNAKEGFHLTPELVHEHWQDKTVGALVASPANPTGGVMSKSQITALHESIGDHSGVLVVDEIYQGLTYGGVENHTAVGLGEDVFVINSFSKYFTMTGWRLGWLVAPKWAVKSVDKLAQNLFLAPSTPAQYAALGLFNEATLNELETRREAFSERLSYLLPQLKALGFRIPVEPEGAFYIYADISAFSQDSMKFCQELLEKEGVAITPGIDFSQAHGEHFVRFAYTAPVDRLKEAVTRIKRFLENCYSE